MLSANRPSVSHYVIVRARPEHLVQVPLVELAAAQLLRGYAPESVLRETTSQEKLEQALRDGQLWVALVNEVVVGFARVEMIDAVTAHLEEVDVLPDYGGRGLGRQLVMHACQWAATAGYGSVTLTTFNDVPWNMPFYQKLGFEVVPNAELSPPLRVRVHEEARHGLDPSRRVVMRRRSGR